MRSDRLLLAAVVAAGLGGSATASAYALIGWDWSWQAAPMSEPFYVNPSSFPASVGTQTQIRAALDNGMARWGNEGLSNFSFNNGGATTQTDWGSGPHIAQWSNTTAGGSTLAVAQSFGFGDRMTECDIRVYAANAYGPIAWSADPNGAGRYEIDLEQTLTHEFGHCAGLDHSSSRSAIMYASATSGAGPADRLLASDDIAGLQAMYGVAAGADLELTMTGSLVAGGTVSLQVSGANPFDNVRVAMSTVGEGNGPCYAVLGGQCAGILAPVSQIGRTNANAAGVATFSWRIPTTYAGLTLGFQAVVLDGADTLMSNTLGGATVAPVGTTCAAGRMLDCQAACWDDDWPGDGSCDDGTAYRWGDPDFNCSLFAFDQGDCAP